MTLRSYRRDQSGFTMLELLIALSIFAIGLLAIASLQISAIRYNAGSNLRTASVGIAQGVMEQIMAMDSDNDIFRTTRTMSWDFDASPPVPPEELFPGSPGPDGNPQTPVTLPSGESYTATITITTDTPATWVSRVSVTVQAPENRSTTLVSFKRYNL